MITAAAHAPRVDRASAWRHNPTITLRRTTDHEPQQPGSTEFNAAPGRSRCRADRLGAPDGEGTPVRPRPHGTRAGARDPGLRRMAVARAGFRGTDGRVVAGGPLDAARARRPRLARRPPAWPSVSGS